MCRYVEEMHTLFERHKAAAGYADRTLEVLAVSDTKKKKKAA